jgi:adenylyl cyclase-associated protein
MASACKEPPQAALAPLLGDISVKMKDLSSAVQRNEWEKHMKTLSEGVQCLNWLLIKPAPRDFIESYIGGSDYWANNIRKEYRTTNPDQIAFCNTFKTLLLELMVYVKEQHTTGVTWNPRGIDVSAYSGSVQPVDSTPVSAASAPTTVKKGVDLFAALNKGGNITSGLKTVTKVSMHYTSTYIYVYVYICTLF